MNFKKYLLIATISMAFTTTAHAEKWIKSGQFYFDYNSIKKEGDIASITFKDSPINPAFRMYFDCIEKTANVYGWPKAISYDNNSILGKVASDTCKKSWQFWK
jgi:hypothetical protein